MILLVGTSGYSYKEWKGNFYPEDISDKEMLSYYGRQLPTVEINNTFYRLPKESVLHAWADQVPPDFQFSIKASQRITHIKRLKDAGDETEYLLRIVRTLGSKLGVILFQLPPNLKKDLARLEQFLKHIPGDVRAAFEFRHASWFEQDVFDCLKANSCALCIADADDELEIPFVATANWGYLRLRRMEYSPNDLKKWMKQVQSQHWDHTFVFFKHEDEGTGPKLAAQFLKLSGSSTAAKPHRQNSKRK
jgi:uncharacterized protein YecE (DUF72 family)